MELVRGIWVNYFVVAHEMRHIASPKAIVDIMLWILHVFTGFLVDLAQYKVFLIHYLFF